MSKTTLLLQTLRYFSPKKFKMSIFRFFHTTICNQTLNKSALAVLRKKTGFGLAHCRKALEINNNDAAKAEEWLKEQAKALGWTAAMKVQDRKTSQGLVGVAINNQKVAMAEVNCETDFVARNDKFKSLVELVTTTCLHLPVLTSGEESKKLHLTKEELGKLTANNTPLNDHLAMLIGSIGENMMLRQAVCFETSRKDVDIAVAVHPPAEDSSVLLGKYGTFVCFKRNSDSSLTDQNSLNIFGSNLCKHIIGMNPLKVGDYEKDKPAKNMENETSLIYQEYLLDQSLTVGELLEESGVTVIDFKRLECGEPEQEKAESNENEPEVNVAKG